MLNRCCFMRLNTFGVIIGWLGIVSSFIGIIILGIGLGNADDLAQWITSQMPKDESAKVDVAAVRFAIVTIGSIYLAITAINFVASAMLVYGTIKERHLLLVPWLLNSGIALFFATLYHIALIIALIASAQSIGEVFMPLVLSFLMLVLQYYIYCGILSLFKQIRNNAETQRQPLNPVTGPAYPSYTKI